MLYLFQDGKCCVVVRLFSDFLDQFAVQNLVVFVQHHDGTSGQAFRRGIGNRYAVVLDELGSAPGRHVLDVFQTVGTAETSLGDRQVSGDAHHDSVGDVIGLGVELAHGSGASRGLD